MVIIGPLLTLFCIFAARVFHPFSWGSEFIPVVSLVYRQHESWAWAGTINAVYAHVGSGIVCFICILVQFDATIRHARPFLHRLSGRIYLMAGIVCVMSLRELRSTSGAGSDPQHRPDSAMVYFIDAASLLWFVITGGAMYFVTVKRDYDRHRQWMTMSMAVMQVPIAQRLMSIAVFNPAITSLRCLVAIVRWGVLPWDAHWGEPGSSWSLLWSEAKPSSDQRVSPLVWSFNGYGEGEQASFFLSAWVGLFGIMFFYMRQVMVYDQGTRRATLSEVFRNAPKRLANLPTKLRETVASLRDQGAAMFGLSMVAVVAGLVLVLAVGLKQVVYYVAVFFGGLALSYSLTIVGVGAIVVVLPIAANQYMFAAGYGYFESFAVGGVALLCGGMAVLLLGPILMQLNSLVYSHALGILFQVITLGLVFDSDAEEEAADKLPRDEENLMENFEPEPFKTHG
eukprot:TRINITY_DN565_c0_g1_i2.p1 TRINITY_DN565_c0_g1~~TRINITY_DN565_c0_g1_i2.p1  ORF type:complete len:454 (+),score=90.95 TRINITY_DN565_c0_g1_i2:350-1711(+)